MKFNSLKVKIISIFSLLILLVFTINWLVALKTIHAQKSDDLKKVLEHILRESYDEYLKTPIVSNDSLAPLYIMPHNKLILKDSEASGVRFFLSTAPYGVQKHQVGTSIKIDSGRFLNATSTHEKIDKAVYDYAISLAMGYIGSLVVILSIGFFLLWHFMKPLEELAKKAREWKNGDSFECDSSNPSSEIGELSHSFSNLVKRVESFRAKEKALFKEMAHELKTPIAIMKARLDAHDSSPLTQELGADLERLMTELKGILFFETSDYEEPCATVPLELVGKILARMEPLIRKKELKISLSGEAFGVVSQPLLLQKLLSALLENAVTYAVCASEITIHASSKTLLISNLIAKEKYLFSSKIGEKILRRISEELGIKYRIDSSAERYTIVLEF